MRISAFVKPAVAVAAVATLEAETLNTLSRPEGAYIASTWSTDLPGSANERAHTKCSFEWPLADDILSDAHVIHAMASGNDDDMAAVRRAIVSGRWATLNDPVSHFLKAYGEIEADFLLGEMDTLYSKYPLKYWKHQCIPTAGSTSPSNATVPQNLNWTVTNKLERIKRFADDVNSNGFFDKRISPQHLVIEERVDDHLAMFMSVARANGLADSLSSQNTEEKLADEHCPKELVSKDDGLCLKNPDGHWTHWESYSAWYNLSSPWQVSVNELMREADADHDGTAVSLIRQICALYAQDYDCIAPSMFPEVCKREPQATESTAVITAQKKKEGMDSKLQQFKSFMRKLPQRKFGAYKLVRTTHPRQAVRDFAEKSLQPMCNLLDLSLSASSFHYLGHGDQALEHFAEARQNEGNLILPKLMIGYAPKMTKTGGTSTEKWMSTVGLSKKELPDIPRAAVRDTYFLFTWIRDPFDRLLSGYSQCESFFYMGWWSHVVSANDLQYWRQFCIPVVNNIDHPQSDFRLPFNTTLEHRIERLSRFVEDIERVGWFDSHLVPQTAFLSLNNMSSTALHFMGNGTQLPEHMDALADALSLSDADRHAEKYAKSMSKAGNPWTVHKAELLRAAASSTDVKDLVIRICMLCATDYQCLPFEPPQLCRELLGR
jgi:hypothetical protein